MIQRNGSLTKARSAIGIGEQDNLGEGVMAGPQECNSMNYLRAQSRRAMHSP